VIFEELNIAISPIIGLKKILIIKDKLNPIILLPPKYAKKTDTNKYVNRNKIIFKYSVFMVIFLSQ